MHKKPLSEEVALVQEVQACRACPWFWEAVPPYGPYPAIDWDNRYPEAMRKPIPQAEGMWTTATSQGDRLPEPAVLRGCRKAPIMTLGINPNLSAYFPGPGGAMRCYPSFAETANYAYYHRHATIYQEGLDEKTIESWIVAGTETVARKDGWLLASERGTDHRWLCLTVKYIDEEEPECYEMAWEPECRAIVLTSTSDRQAIESGVPAFRKGTILAARIKSPEGTSVPVYEIGCGYYQRLEPVLQECRSRFGFPDDAEGPAIGEDVCMYDMVGCASPGWSSRYDIPRTAIAKRCVEQKDYVLRQLLQSRPAVLILVSTSSLRMFEQSFTDRGGSLTFESQDRDVYDLLKETCERRHYFSYEDKGVSYRARVIVSPHFSYPDNFLPHSRFSSEAWEGFCTEFPRDAKALEEDKRIGDPLKNGMIPVLIKEDDPLKKDVGYAAWQILRSRFYDPFSLITEALVDEYKQGNLVPDRQSDHLKRTDGACTFCSNALWQFPEGCPYDKC